MSSTTSAKKEVTEYHRNKPDKIFIGMATNILKHAIILYRIFVDWVIDLVFGYYWDSKRVKIPDLDKRHSILAESAVDIAAKIRNKQLKSEDLVKICIERVKLVNPIINAVTDERYDAALKEAREIDQKIASGLSDEYFKKKPFLGVPFTAKESHAVAGLLHTLGVLSRKDIRAHEDAECVRLMREAGAIPLAVTNVPEINKWMEARNYVFGQTNNPHHTGRTAGGSSGGEAALHAAVTVPISLCSDIGGSTRMPAFFNGLYALNPTPGHTSLKGSGLRTGDEPTMAAIGFSSRHPGDLGPLTKIVAGDKAHLLNLDRVVDVKKLKFYFVESSDDWRPSPICADQRNVMKKAIAKLTEDAVSTAHVPQQYYHTGFNYMFLLWRYWMTHEVEDFASMITNRKSRASFWRELAKKCVGMCDYTFPALMKLFDEQVVPPVNKDWAEATTTELKDALLELLGDDGVLLFPSCPLPASYHYAPILRPFNFGYWAVFNALQFPAAQVPCGVNSDGIPLGIQVVAAPRHDALCTAVAAVLGPALGGAQPPCKID